MKNFREKIKKLTMIFYGIMMLIFFGVQAQNNAEIPESIYRQGEYFDPLKYYFEIINKKPIDIQKEKKIQEILDKPEKLQTEWREKFNTPPSQEAQLFQLKSTEKLVLQEIKNLEQDIENIDIRFKNIDTFLRAENQLKKHAHRMVSEYLRYKKSYHKATIQQFKIDFPKKYKILKSNYLSSYKALPPILKRFVQDPADSDLLRYANKISQDWASFKLRHTEIASRSEYETLKKRLDKEEYNFGELVYHPPTQTYILKNQGNYPFQYYSLFAAINEELTLEKIEKTTLQEILRGKSFETGKNKAVNAYTGEIKKIRDNIARLKHSIKENIDNEIQNILLNPREKENYTKQLARQELASQNPRYQEALTVLSLMQIEENVLIENGNELDPIWTPNWYRFMDGEYEAFSKLIPIADKDLLQEIEDQSNENKFDAHVEYFSQQVLEAKNTDFNNAQAYKKIYAIIQSTSHNSNDKRDEIIKLFQGYATELEDQKKLIDELESSIGKVFIDESQAFPNDLTLMRKNCIEEDSKISCESIRQLTYTCLPYLDGSIYASQDEYAKNKSTGYAHQPLLYRAKQGGSDFVIAPTHTCRHLWVALKVWSDDKPFIEKFAEILKKVDEEIDPKNPYEFYEKIFRLSSYQRKRNNICRNSTDINDCFSENHHETTYARADIINDKIKKIYKDNRDQCEKSLEENSVHCQKIAKISEFLKNHASKENKLKNKKGELISKVPENFETILEKHKDKKAAHEACEALSGESATVKISCDKSQAGFRTLIEDELAFTCSFLNEDVESKILTGLRQKTLSIDEAIKQVHDSVPECQTYLRVLSEKKYQKSQTLLRGNICLAYTERSLKRMSFDEITSACGVYGSSQISNIAFREWKRFQSLALGKTGYHEAMSDNRLIEVIDKELDTKSFFRNFWQDQGVVFTTNIVIGTMALVYIFILGVQYVIARGDEETINKTKQRIVYIVIGLAFASFAQFAGLKVFDPTQDVLEGGDVAVNFYNKINQIKIYLQYIVGTIAIIMGIISGYNIIVADESDTEVVDKEKQFIKAFLFGGGVILMSEVAVKGIFFVNEDHVDVVRGITELTSLINFSLGFIAGITGLIMVLASLYYVSSFGNEDQASRAKNMIISCIIALVICFSAFTISRFLLGYFG